MSTEQRSGSAMAAAGVFVVALCCGLPALVVVAGLAGSWFAAHGIWLGAGVAAAAAAGFGLRTWRTRRAFAKNRSESHQQ